MSQRIDPPNQDAEIQTAETPMYAVWLSLGFILLLGLHGLNIGVQALSKAKAATEEKTSAALVTPGTPEVIVEGRTFA